MDLGLLPEGSCSGDEGMTGEEKGRKTRPTGSWGEDRCLRKSYLDGGLRGAQFTRKQICHRVKMYKNGTAPTYTGSSSTLRNLRIIILALEGSPRCSIVQANGVEYNIERTLSNIIETGSRSKTTQGNRSRGGPSIQCYLPWKSNRTPGAAVTFWIVLYDIYQEEFWLLEYPVRPLNSVPWRPSSFKLKWLQAPVTAYTDPPRPRPTYTNLARARQMSTDYAPLLGPYTQAESRKAWNAVRDGMGKSRRSGRWVVVKHDTGKWVGSGNRFARVGFADATSIVGGFVSTSASEPAGRMELGEESTGEAEAREH
ncbi:hypothetical protein B0H13DRAFT_1909479 [Mycena leptocephala]|nr:hypothetical protein B0H13DRAFT_1909479 [Mycena leptocephala]